MHSPSHLKAAYATATPAEHSVRLALLERGSFIDGVYPQAVAQANRWIALARERARLRASTLAILDEFGLGSVEGMAVMRLAEGLLRTRDSATAWQLLRETLGEPAWRTSKDARISVKVSAALCRALAGMLRRNATPRWLAAPVTHLARVGVRRGANDFVVAESVRKALRRMRRDAHLKLCSLDCLGESARTRSQARAYLAAYRQAVRLLAEQPSGTVHERHGISVKLSALEPRFGPRYRQSYRHHLIPAMTTLAREAASAGIGLTIDAEEQERLESTLDIFGALMEDATTNQWDGLGIVVQAYGLRAVPAVEWLLAQARHHGRRINVRLVKGAYWDAEIKHAQERGTEDYPVFTHRAATDVSYLCVARRLFESPDAIFPQFASHNALTISMIQSMAPVGARFEFQRLHGMGEDLYAVAGKAASFPNVRVYAPVGSHEDLLSYLVRRLLENGANASFVRYLLDPATPVAALTGNPLTILRGTTARVDPEFRRMA